MSNKKNDFRNKEDAIMDWALMSIGTLTALLSVISLHFILREEH